MDNSPQTNAETEQKPETEPQNHYQQYLNTEPENKSNKRRKMLLIIVAVTSALLIVLVILAVIISGGDKKENNQTAQSGPIACSDEGCFSQNLVKCLPAEYTTTEAGNRLKYSITGVGELGCATDIEYLEAQTVPDAAGKKMACDFDNTIAFKDAAQNVLDFPEDYGCTGDLLTPLQIFNETSAES